MLILRILWTFFIELPWVTSTPIVDKAIVKLNELFNGKNEK